LNKSKNDSIYSNKFFSRLSSTFAEPNEQFRNRISTLKEYAEFKLNLDQRDKREAIAKVTKLDTIMEDKISVDPGGYKHQKTTSNI
jgi:hypothetical protein